jgi:hypothetical protein
LRVKVAEGSTAQAAADDLIARTLAKYAGKGDRFAKVFANRPSKTRATLLERLVA